MSAHLEKVLDCFVRMDVEGLGLLLSDQFTYSDEPKDKFLEALMQLFNDYRSENPGYFWELYRLGLLINRLAGERKLFVIFGFN
jgi:hypothetical protein